MCINQKEDHDDWEAGEKGLHGQDWTSETELIMMNVNNSRLEEAARVESLWRRSQCCRCSTLREH